MSELKMKLGVRTITPEIAKKLLAENHSQNRNVSQKHVHFLSEEMVKGWKMTGEAIKIGMSGTILDGQHRLHAVVNSGQTIEALFIENLNDDIFEVLDTGKNRSSGDVLHIYGIEDAAKVAAIAKFVINYVPRKRNFQIGAESPLHNNKSRGVRLRG